MPDRACPEEVAAAILEILRTAILSMRLASSRGDSRYCNIEANHIHNLPNLLLHYHPDKLGHYLDGQRLTYIEELQELPGSNMEVCAPQWSVLEKTRARTPSESEGKS